MGTAVMCGNFGTPDQHAVLADIDPILRQEMEAHLERRRLWFPNDLLCADEQMSAESEDALKALREGARGLPDFVRVSIALSLLTEEGLPHFHRLIAMHFGSDSAWGEWNNLWTAEEDRHGCVLRDYSREARIFNMRALERMQYDYIEAGFNPQWQQDPYRLLAYTSLQERATQYAHANTGRACANYEPTIQRILAHISGDESRHYQFYRRMFAEILARDPNKALYSLSKVMPALAMPGHMMPNYEHIADIVRQADIYGPRHYCKIVEELLEYWQIGALTGLSADGRQMQEKLMKIPARLSRMADHLDVKNVVRSYSFDFLYDRSVS